MTAIPFTSEILIEILKGGDTLPFKRGTTVVKIAEDTGGSVSKIGTEGIVIGGLTATEKFLTEAPEKYRNIKAIYLVWFDKAPFPTLVIDTKIKQIHG